MQMKDLSQISKTNSRRRRRAETIYQRIEKTYGLTQLELDTLIIELAERYNCQWGIVSNALFRQHQIYMKDKTICYRYAKIRPKNEKEGYDRSEQNQLVRMFFVEGKRYKQIREFYGFRGQHSIRNVLYRYTAAGLRKLEAFIKKEIIDMRLCALPKNQVISILISNYGLKWEYNQYTLSVLYIFMAGHQTEFQKIPNDLALVLYQRLLEIAREKQQQRQEMYKLVDPQVAQYIQTVRKRMGMSSHRQNRLKQQNDLQHSKDENQDEFQNASFSLQLPQDFELDELQPSSEDQSGQNAFNDLQLILGHSVSEASNTQTQE